jgi:hypothetical protein
MNAKDSFIEMAVSDAIAEKPIQFNIGKRRFSIHPPTLGKMQILSKYYLLLELDEKALGEAPHLEAMRVCESKTDIVCALMAVATFREKEELLNDEKIAQRAEFFKWNTQPADFSTILLALLTQIHYENFIISIRLTKTLRQNASKA